MKKFTVFLIFMTFQTVVYGQHLFSDDYCVEWYIFDFEDNTCHKQMFIDTVPDQLWQIGKPQKIVFNTSHSLPNAIITDTINSYPVNSNSSFIVKHLADQGFEYDHTVAVSGYYNVDSDSLPDFGKIEFSGDNGISWVDLLNDSIYETWLEGVKPILTGNSNGWKFFYLGVTYLKYYFNIRMGDTVQFKFSFISDSIDNHKDGLMFDDLLFEDYAEGIEKQKLEPLELYPNPVTNSLTIKADQFSGSNCVLNIYRSDGKLQYQIIQNLNNITVLNVADYPGGIYLLEAINLKTNERKIARFCKVNQ